MSDQYAASDLRFQQVGGNWNLWNGSEMKFRMIAGKPGLWTAGLLIFFIPLLGVSQQHKQNSSAHSAQRQDARQLFATTCAACHGLDGMGSERAPNIITNSQAQKLSASELFTVISDGVPGTGMPPFQRLGKAAITSLVAYVKGLQGKIQSAPLPGNPRSGEALFFGDAQCSTCHMASGRGGFIAPDLSNYGQTHAAGEIKSAITNPATRDSIKPIVTVTSANGDRYQGIIRNEDNFSLQLQSTDGTFHFLSKAELTNIDRGQDSIMPNYASRLNEAQLNDIVSYLLNLAKTSVPTPAAHRTEDE
jgi:cytochrome c oxidase cbb3-type subunit III